MPLFFFILNFTGLTLSISPMGSSTGSNNTMDHFVNPSTEYRRQYDLTETYLRDAARYISTMRDISFEEALAVVKEITSEPDYALKDPEVLALYRGENGDRTQTVTTFNGFISDVFGGSEMLAPNLTAFVPPEKEVSLLALYIDGNLTLRKKAKHQMFTFKMAGDDAMANIYNSMQTTYKIKNNALSGAHSSPYTPLWNKSSHSTLTSTCRVATSYGNANNEKFLYGNRHYYSPDIARQNIISIISHSDLETMSKVMLKYGIVPPNNGHLRQLLVRCTENYWVDKPALEKLYELTDRLSDMEKAAFAYTSDLYHLSVVNDKFVREFLGRLSKHVTDPLPLEEADVWIKKMDSNMEAFIFMLCSKELAGGTMSDALGDKSNKKLRDVRPDDYGRIAATAKNAIETLDYYADFIRAFWVTDNLPSSVFALPSIVRKSAVTSDTDSTIFTVQHWTTWYRGQLDFTKESEDIASTMFYLAGQLIRHILATTSGTMGVSPRHVNRLSMKNEYYFPVFSLTSRAKHYYAFRAAQEGNVLKELELEVKGVALRSSKVPPAITARAHELIKYIMREVMAGRMLKLRELLAFVGETEEMIINGVFAGKSELLSRVQVKEAAAYKVPESSPLVHYDMWETVFAPNYGNAPAPPYGAVKVPVSLGNKSSVRKWLDTMDSPAISDRMEKWLTEKGKDGFSMMILPDEVMSVHGIPREIQKVVNIRPHVAEMMESFYLILESLGYFLRNANNTRLVSDEKDAYEGWSVPAALRKAVSGNNLSLEDLELEDEEDEEMSL